MMPEKTARSESEQSKNPYQKAKFSEMANAIRALSMDAVQKANSGHPGMPMGMADVATVLFSEFLKFDPKNPTWPDRDRFVLSAGHGSMLLYSLLYLTGYKDFPIEELKNFRQLGSKTAGHPEHHESPAIETTTGPLGQGLANSVGMAMAEQLLAARYGNLVDHNTYVIAGDGCLMEGISHEAISLAGHLHLGKLIVFFDDNDISIDGPTSLSVSDDQIKRFQASGWHTQSIDGHDENSIRKAIEAAQKSDKPSLIACKTTIGFGAPNKAGTADCHGSPLGDEEIAGARKNLNWQSKPFEVPQHILDAWRAVGAKGAEKFADWESICSAADKKLLSEFERTQKGQLPKDFKQAINELKKKVSEEKPKDATRKSSGNVLDKISPIIPELIGGSADLTGSNNTKAKGQEPVTKDDFSGRYIYYGVREHAMCAAMNGMALHGGIIPYGGTFFVFTDYCRPAIRLAALMKQRVVFVMTHDSIGLGEDGPTHQPIEHLASLRAMPGVDVLRPADGVETAECWDIALNNKNKPSILVLTRQGLPTIRTEHTEENLCEKGGYVVSENKKGEAKVTLIATGSEVSIALEAQEKLHNQGIEAKVVSMPCTELFDAQSEKYKCEVLGSGLKLAIEAAAKFGWERYIGNDGIFVGMEGFGASAPAGDLYKHFGITSDNVVKHITEKLK